MNAYLSGIGFSYVHSGEALQVLLGDAAGEHARKTAFTSEDGRPLLQYSRSYAKDCGIRVVGQTDGDGHFHAEYYEPWLRSSRISLNEEMSIELRTERDSYACICDDARLGFTLIFTLTNMAEFLNTLKDGRLRSGRRMAALSGIAMEGVILLPVRKSKRAEKIRREAARERQKKIDAARDGDEDATESLSMEEVDTYSMISRRLEKEDILTIVESTFMPCGVECDQYQVIGTIESYEYVQNIASGETLCQMMVLCNDMPVRISVNSADLLGRPEVGRRFKGRIVLMGEVLFD